MLVVFRYQVHIIVLGNFSFLKYTQQGLSLESIAILDKEGSSVINWDHVGKTFGQEDLLEKKSDCLAIHADSSKL